MRELVRMLTPDLKYIKHEIHEDTIFIHVKSKRKDAHCPYCGKLSNKVHSKYIRKLQDLPIQGKKVKLLMIRNKYFCKNVECSKGTFAEKFDFFGDKSTMTNRLEEEILRVSLTQSSVSASRYLKAGTADVSKSTICNLLKKGREKEC